MSSGTWPLSVSVSPGLPLASAAFFFPPSINLVIYSIATAGMNATGPNGEPVGSASVGALFLAGILPALSRHTSCRQDAGAPSPDAAGQNERCASFRIHDDMPLTECHSCLAYCQKMATNWHPSSPSTNHLFAVMSRPIDDKFT